MKIFRIFTSNTYKRAALNKEKSHFLSTSNPEYQISEKWKNILAGGTVISLAVSLGYTTYAYLKLRKENHFLKTSTDSIAERSLELENQNAKLIASVSKAITEITSVLDKKRDFSNKSTNVLELELSKCLSDFTDPANYPQSVKRALSLIAQGADVNFKKLPQPGAGTALHTLFLGLYRAVNIHKTPPSFYEQDTLKLVNAIINAGVNVNAQFLPLNLLLPDLENPLQAAIRLHLPSVVERLLMAGAPATSKVAIYKPNGTNFSWGVTNLQGWITYLKEQAPEFTNEFNEIIDLLNAYEKGTSTTTPLLKEELLTLYKELEQIQKTLELYPTPITTSVFNQVMRSEFSYTEGIAAALWGGVISVGGILAAEGKQALQNPLKLAGKSMVIISLVIFILYASKEYKDAKREIKRITDGVVEAVVAGKKTLEDIGETSKSATVAIAELRQTNQMVAMVTVELLDEAKNCVVRLIGSADKVANAIERGINENRFKPEAKVHIEKLDINTSNKVGMVNF